MQVASTSQPGLETTSAVTSRPVTSTRWSCSDAEDGGLTLATHPDAVSAAVTPSGSIETGGGGTAGPHLLLWLPAGVGAAGIALLAAAYVRSRRSPGLHAA